MFELFHTYNLTNSHPLDQRKISHPVSNLFTFSILLSLLFLSYPYNSELISEFFSNLLISCVHFAMQSFYQYKKFGITITSLQDYLQASTSSPSTHAIFFYPLHDQNIMNLVLKGAPPFYHYSKTNFLVLNMFVIQHVLLNNIMSKVRD